MRLGMIHKRVKNFLRENTKGGVTVFICLILIPLMIFTGLMTDLARIKLYHSEAAGTANSYADAVLSQYDELLYDVYGLLAVTQDEEGLKALDTIKEYMVSASNTSDISGIGNMSESDLKNIPANIVFVGKDNSALEGAWSPYGDTGINLERSLDNSGGDGATLANEYIFADQVCDYMKIIGPVDLAWNGITDALDSSETNRENTKLMNMRQTVDNNYSKLDEELEKLYKAILDVEEYDEWSVPEAAASFFGNTFVSGFNGIKENAEDVYGELEDIRDEIKEYLENGSGSEEELLDRLDDYRAVIKASSDPDDPNWIGDLDQELRNWSDTYMLTIQIELLEGEVNAEYNSLQEEIREDRPIGICNDVKQVISRLTGGTDNVGLSATGAAEYAAIAESSRSDLINYCGTKTGNKMAEGLADEYSFEAKAETGDRIAINKIDNTSHDEDGDLAFVGTFDYKYLAGRYDGCLDHLDAVRALLGSDRAELAEQQDKLKYLRDGILDYIDELEDYLRYGADQTQRAEIDFDDHCIDSGGLNFLSGNYKDSVEDHLDSGSGWFSISDGNGYSGDKTKRYSVLWDILSDWYSSGGSSEQTEAKTTEYKGILSDLKELITDDAGQDVIAAFEDMTIPDCIGAEDKGDADGKNITSLFDEDGNFDIPDEPEKNKYPRSSEYYLTKLLMMDYDWNFFAGATFGKNKDDNNKLAGKTLKGETVDTENNYLVRAINENTEDEYYAGAELEYIYWGDSSAQKNLKAVRNQIMVIRAVENYASTYSIKELNNAVLAVRNALSGIPIAALVVPPLIRAAIAMAETYMDLQELYGGNDIVLYKTELKHLSLVRRSSDLIEDLKPLFESEEGMSSPFGGSGGGTDGNDPITFNYSQYVIAVTMMFCDTSTIIQRTQDLVELNMNHRLGVNVSGAADKNSLKFKLSEASVGVSATCELSEMNLLMLGGVFNSATVDNYTDEGGTDILKNGFSYTVYRSY